MHPRDRNRMAVLAMIDRDSAHYAQRVREKQHRLSDMKTIASQIALCVVDNVVDQNAQAIEPYYCIPHEAPQ